MSIIFDEFVKDWFHKNFTSNFPKKANSYIYLKLIKITRILYYVLPNPIYCAEVVQSILDTIRYGRYAPILLAPAEGWGTLRAFIGAFHPSSVREGSKQSILNLESK